MNAEMLKGHLDNVILATLAQEPAHGYAVIEAIRSRSMGRFDLAEGTVYPALHRLELAGLLSSTWINPPSGRRKRIYSLSSAGRGALAQRREGWAQFSGAISAFMGPGETWPA